MKMKQAEFIALSACTMTLTALGIDIMLPAFGAVREHFGLAPESTTTAQNHLVLFPRTGCTVIFLEYSRIASGGYRFFGLDFHSI